jgi:hypothetical protein
MPADSEQIDFYDSAAGEFPDGAQYVALYVDGDYRYKGGRDFEQEHWITVLGDPKVLIADYEPGNLIYSTPGWLRIWADRRIAMHRRAVIYSDRADLHQAHHELGPVLSTHPGLLWWIPTLDGGDWTAQSLANDIAANWGVWIPPSRIWANQRLDTGVWDESELFGAWH